MSRWRKSSGDPTPRAGEPGSEETRNALRHASSMRDDALRRDKDIKQVSGRLREVRERNHFGELITKVLTEGK